MSVDEILQAMKDFIAAVTPAEGGDPAMTDEEAARYAALEEQLRLARQSAEVMKRHSAYTAISAPKVTMTTNAHGGDEQMRAFNDFLRTGRANQDMVRAQSEGVGSAGGYLVPEQFTGKLIEKMKAFGGLQAAAAGITTSTGAPLSWLTTDPTSASNAGIVAENAQNSFGADVSFDKRALGAYKYDTGGASGDFLKVPWELLQDAEFDLTGYIAKLFGQRIARKLAVDLVNGSGVSEPQGIISTQGALTDSGVTIASATAGPTYAELVTIEHSLDPAYRENGAVWLMNDKTLSLIEKLVDGQQRPLIWSAGDSLGAGNRGRTLNGYPVVIDQAMPDLLTGSTRGLVFGALSDAYIVRTIKDVTMIQDPYSFARNGQTGFMAWARFDGMVQDPNAAVYVTSHA